MEWGVETMHWLLDVRYREDYFRAQNENIQKNMNMSRKLALYLARVYKNKHSKKTPLSHIMFDCLMDPHHLLTVLGKNFSSVERKAEKSILKDITEFGGRQSMVFERCSEVAVRTLQMKFSHERA